MHGAAPVSAELVPLHVWWGLAALVWLPGLTALGAWSLAQPADAGQLGWVWAVAVGAAALAMVSMRRVGTGELTARDGGWFWRQGPRLRSGRVALRADLASHVLLEFFPSDGQGAQRPVWLLARPRGGEGVAWRRALVADGARGGRTGNLAARPGEPPAGAAS